MAKAEEEIDQALRGLRCRDEVVRAVREGALGAKRGVMLAHLIASDVRAAAGKPVAPETARRAMATQPALEEFPPADAIYVMRAQQCSQPRGRFDLAWTPSRLLLASAKKRYSISYTDIARGFGVTRARGARAARRAAVLALRRAVPHGKQALLSIAITPCLEQKRAEEGQLAPCAGAGGDYPVLSGEAFDLAASAFAKASGGAVCLQTGDGLFASAQGHTSVGAYFRSVNDGELFPRREGLLFLDKPVLFLPVHTIETVQLGRGGACSARSFDIEVRCRDGTTHTFSMIDRAEVEPLAMYVRALGIGADGAAGAGGASVKRERAQGNGEEEDEEEFFPPGEGPAAAIPASTGGEESRAGAEGDDEDSAGGGEAGSPESDSESGPASNSGLESDSEGSSHSDAGCVSDASGDRMVAASRGEDGSEGAVSDEPGDAANGAQSRPKLRVHRRGRRAAAAVAARRMGATIAAAAPAAAAVKAEPVAAAFVRDASEQPDGKRARS